MLTSRWEWKMARGGYRRGRADSGKSSSRRERWQGPALILSSQLPMPHGPAWPCPFQKSTNTCSGMGTPPNSSHLLSLDRPLIFGSQEGGDSRAGGEARRLAGEERYRAGQAGKGS